ncbi:MAG: hypothetical protein RIC30_00395 [Marinoscillum sp.]|uniref:hypothetical protein n=1 Tax=Marinoscillum sp. TaxID=2024838 RepID=UPI003302708D
MSSYGAILQKDNLEAFSESLRLGLCVHVSYQIMMRKPSAPEVLNVNNTKTMDSFELRRSDISGIS